MVPGIELFQHPRLFAGFIPFALLLMACYSRIRNKQVRTSQRNRMSLTTAAGASRIVSALMISVLEFSSMSIILNTYNLALDYGAHRRQGQTLISDESETSFHARSGLEARSRTRCFKCSATSMPFRNLTASIFQCGSSRGRVFR